MIDFPVRKSCLPGAPRALGVLTSWGGRHSQHRYEDFALIQAILRDVRPSVGVELGTDEGGFACMLADTLAEWGGRVVTVDLVARCGSLGRANLEQWAPCDCLATARQDIVDLVGIPRGFLYCDNGNKARELTLYAPHVGAGGLVGVHDYDTEVDPVLAEAFMALLGYHQERHAEFEALAHPQDYPYSLTRMWRRV